jgi:hypothetical protein
MGKAEYGHNAGNELRRVRHYLSAQEQKCDGNDCTACRRRFIVNGGERVPVTMHQRWGKRAQADGGDPGELGHAPQWPLRMGTGDVIPGMRALPAELRDRPGVP